MQKGPRSARPPGRSRRLISGLLAIAGIVAVLAGWRIFERRQTGAAKQGQAGPESPAREVPWGPAREIHRPSRVPDRVILSWTKDPARSQAVTWRTDAAEAPARAQLATAGPGPDLAQRALSVSAVTTPLSTDLGDAHYHTVVFDDLAPATKYAYRVGDGTTWSEWFQFRTASDAPAPFSFVYFGDAQNDIKSLWSRVVREAFADAPRMAFLLHAGDLVSDSESDAMWGEWFGAGGWVNAAIPNLPTPGNHEYSRAFRFSAKRLCSHWRPQFALPENGPEGLKETVYFVDYQGTRVISLDSNVEQQRQAAWLDKVLSNNPQTWTIVTFHHPLFSSALARDNPELRALWKPVIDKHSVDLVLQGHDHTYARTGHDVPDTIASGNVSAGAERKLTPHGTVYVVSVSGPKMYGLERQSFMRRAAEETQLYQIIRIDGAALRFEARTASGDLYDAFTLKKRPGQPNELIEQVPDSPERIVDRRAE